MRRYLYTFLRYWYIALIPVVVLPLAVYHFDKETRTQTAYASQYIRANQSVLGALTIYNSGQTPAQNEAAIIDQLVRDPSFDQLVASSTPTYAQALARRGSAGPDAAVTDLSSNVQVSAPGYNLVSVSYGSDTGDQRVAQAVLGAVLVQADQQTVQQQQGLYGDQQTTLRKQFNGVKQHMARDDKALLKYLRQKHYGLTPDAIAQHTLFDPTLNGLYQQVQIDQGSINSIAGSIRDIQNKSDALGLALPGGTTTTFSFGFQTYPGVVHGPNKKLISLLVALALGLLLGGGFVLLRTALDRSLRFVDDVPQLLELPVLGVVPHARQRANGRGGADAPRARTSGA